MSAVRSERPARAVAEVAAEAAAEAVAEAVEAAEAVEGVAAAALRDAPGKNTRPSARRAA